MILIGVDLTAPWVATGIKAGVFISPKDVCIRPALALLSFLFKVKI